MAGVGVLMVGVSTWQVSGTPVLGCGGLTF